MKPRTVPGGFPQRGEVRRPPAVLTGAPQRDAPPRSAPLTAREREVLALVAEGHANKRIGLMLGITERTVKNHLTCIMAKLDASDRTHAVVTAVRQGWLTI